MAATVWAGLVQNAGVEKLDKIAVAWTDQSARVHMGEGNVRHYLIAQRDAQAAPTSKQVAHSMNQLLISTSPPQLVMVFMNQPERNSGLEQLLLS